MRKNVVVQKKALRLRKTVSRKPKLTEIARRERAKRMRVFLTYLSGVVIAGLFVYFFFFSPFAEIRHINIQAKSVSVFGEEVASVVEAYKDEKKWYLFARKNFFFFSCEDLKRKLEDSFLSLSDIAISKKFPDSVTISFSERSVAANWCGRQRCLVLDREGYAFEEGGEAQNMENGKNALPTIVNENISEGTLRETLASREMMERVLLWDDFFRSRLSAEFGAWYYVEPEKFEEYRIRTEKGWELRVGKDIPIEDIFESLRAFLETLPPDRRNNLVSIDLRVDGKIFFTEKNVVSGEEGNQNTENAGEPKKETKNQEMKTEKKKQKE